MPFKKDPVFRKAVIPWYRSSKIYVFAIFFMLLVFLFGIAGISVAQEIEAYRNYIWVPSLLVAMSAFMIVTTTYRLIKRYITRTSKDRFLF
jgi:uncharacterized membrane protein